MNPDHLKNWKQDRWRFIPKRRTMLNLPPPHIQGILTIQEYAHLPKEQRDKVSGHLLTERIGYWMWSAIRMRTDCWLVQCWKHAPTGGPLWGTIGGQAAPLTYIRVIPPLEVSFLDPEENGQRMEGMIRDVGNG